MNETNFFFFQTGVADLITDRVQAIREYSQYVAQVAETDLSFAITSL